jgi:hypothetical protein
MQKLVFKIARRNMFLFALLSQSFAHAGGMIGKYMDDLSLSAVCQVSTLADVCSGTLIDDNFIITARHCVFKIRPPWPVPSVICENRASGAIAVRKVIEIRLLNSSPDDHYSSDEVDVSSDIAILSLEIRHDVSNSPTIPTIPIRLVRSEEEARNLLSSHSCFFSGWGKGNGKVDGKTLVGQPGGDSGIQHTVQAPSIFMIGSVRAIGHVNDEIYDSLIREKPISTARLKEALNVSPAEEVMYGLRAAALDEPIFDPHNPPDSDQSIYNATQDGDSGGPLFCQAREKGKDVYVQVGITSAGTTISGDRGTLESHFILLSQLKVQTFLKETMATLN